MLYDGGGLYIYRSGAKSVALGPTVGDLGAVQVYNSSGRPVAALQALPEDIGQVSVAGDGTDIARLGADPTALGQLTLRFYQGSTKVSAFGANATGGLLQVYDPSGSERAELSTDKTGQSGLYLLKGNTILSGLVGVSVGGLLQINDGSGKQIVKLAENGASGTVGVYHGSDSARALLATNKSGQATLNLYYANGQVAAQLDEVNSGGYLALTNPAGLARVEGGVQPDDVGILRAYGPGGFDFIKGR